MALPAKGQIIKRGHVERQLEILQRTYSSENKGIRILILVVQQVIL